MFLSRKAIDLIFEERQKPDLVDPMDQFLPAADAVWVVPIHSPHDPLAVLNGHGQRLPFQLITGIIAQQWGKCHENQFGKSNTKQMETQKESGIMCS